MDNLDAFPFRECSSGLLLMCFEQFHYCLRELTTEQKEEFTHLVQSKSPKPHLS